MFNVTVLKMRDLIKYFIGTLITICVIIYTSKYFSSNKKDEVKNNNSLKIEFGSLTSCLDNTIPAMSSINEEYNEMEKENEEKTSTNYLQQFLKTEISSIKGMEELEKIGKEENTNEENQITENTHFSVIVYNTILFGLYGEEGNYGYTCSIYPGTCSKK